MIRALVLTFTGLGAWFLYAHAAPGVALLWLGLCLPGAIGVWRRHRDHYRAILFNVYAFVPIGLGVWFVGSMDYPHAARLIAVGLAVVLGIPALILYCKAMSAALSDAPGPDGWRDARP